MPSRRTRSSLSTNNTLSLQSFDYQPLYTCDINHQVEPRSVVPCSVQFAQPLGLSFNKMAQMTPAEMEEFQNMSDRYQAELPGPLIGDKLPMAALVTEYAQADPQFVVKTTALAHTHSAYRSVKGDGQCGWRASVFAYFELLQQLGDMSIVQQETIRLRSFEDTMKMVGIDYDIIIDMFDFTWELLEEVRKAVERQDKDENVILNILNDEIKSNSIVYHFKMMTSAFMQLRADQYEPFLEMTIYEYRVARIDPSNQEIDQIGLQALTDAVISPAGFALEVLYLDRSTGEEVTPYPFSQAASDAPMIRLLYRPGHYDVIYRDSQAPVQVYLQHSQMIPTHVEDANHPTSTSDLQSYVFPGTSTQQDSHFSRRDNDGTSEHRYHQHPSVLLQDEDQYYSSQAQYPQPLPNVVMGAPFDQIQYSSSRSTTTSPPAVQANFPIPKEPQIRLNANVFNLHRHESAPIDSNILSNASSSTAHFRNADFQPQMWEADADYQARQ